MKITSIPTVLAIASAVALPSLAQAADVTPAEARAIAKEAAANAWMNTPSGFTLDDARQRLVHILRLYSPLEPFFTKEWRPSEIELLK